MDCPKCGAILKSGAKYCEACGTTTGAGIKEAADKAEANYELFKENRQAEVSSKNTIGYPEIWMYVFSLFFPLLQWILVGVYVSKNQFDEAKSLLIKPLIAQIIFYVLLVVIFWLVLDL